jgi:DNA-binding transcriptional regulator YdaS (Cro superfamily)
MDQGIANAIIACGSQAELARRLGITGAAISRWKQIPLGRVLQIVSVTGVPKEQLRPDIYGPKTEAAE